MQPSDIRTLSGAQLVFMNGLNLDDWLSKTVDSVASHAPVIKLAVDLPGATYEVGKDPNGPANPQVSWPRCAAVAARSTFVRQVQLAL